MESCLLTSHSLSLLSVILSLNLCYLLLQPLPLFLDLLDLRFLHVLERWERWDLSEIIR